MAEIQEYDLVVLGSGPGGYVAAIRAAQLGLKTAIIEKDKPGGVCLNIGCIPSKALIEQAGIYHTIKKLGDLGVKTDTSSFDYKAVFNKSRNAAEKLSKGVQYLLRKNTIEYIAGTGRFRSAHEIVLDDDSVVRGKNIIIATGSRPRIIKGFEFDEKDVLSSTGLLMLEKLPESILILGAGAIGIEFGYVMNEFGVEVTIVEMMPRILPLEDPDSSELIRKMFVKSGMKILTGTKALSMKKGKQGINVELQDSEGNTSSVSVEKLLVAVGRVPNSEDLGLKELGVETDAKGFIKVGDFFETAVRGIFAIGDVINTPLLAHLASKEGEIAVEHIAGRKTHPTVDPAHVPFVTYSEPQIASFGLNSETAGKIGRDFKAYVFPYRGAGKSVAVEKPDGFVKILFAADTHEILGAHVAGSEASEMIHELLLAKKAELLPEDIAGMIHAHPTLSEAVMEAARGVEGWPVHI